jgi:gamma-glutamyltranspeptidase/glutathione hydrolase
MTVSVRSEALLSRRSVVYGTNGVTATSQPMAARIRLRVLEDSGNTVDAAVTAPPLADLENRNRVGVQRFVEDSSPP